VISRELAEALAKAGLVWRPANGDRFLVPDRDLDDTVFVISDMTIDVVDVPWGALVRFNGTVEWALDSIMQHQVVWLPREDQLRDALGDRLLRLERLPEGYAAVVGTPAGEERYADADAERAYARALLSVM
jgi:hypothetical protein